MSDFIAINDHGPIRELRLARAPVNALNPALCDALRDAVAAAIADGVSGLVLVGGPKVFSAGLDVPHLLSLEDATALRAAWESFFGAARALLASPIPIAAVIAGHAPAGGCVLALCCDYRVMARGAYRIGLNETRVGLIAPQGIQQLLRRVVGAHRSERMLVSGDMVESEQALAIGLVDELVEIDGVAARAHAWLEDLLRLPRKPMLQTRGIARADIVGVLDPENVDLDRFVDAWNDPDTQAGLRALVAKLGK